MLRRQFLKGIITGLVSLPFISSRRLRIRNEKLPLFGCMVAGFQYHAGPQIIGQLQPGTPLELRLEPDNIHDLRAVAVYTPEGRKLGYIPRLLNAVPASHMDNGKMLQAVIKSTAPQAPPWEMLEIVVQVEIVGQSGGNA